MEAIPFDGLECYFEENVFLLRDLQYVFDDFGKVLLDIEIDGRFGFIVDRDDASAWAVENDINTVEGCFAINCAVSVKTPWRFFWANGNDFSPSIWNGYHSFDWALF